MVGDDDDEQALPAGGSIVITGEDSERSDLTPYCESGPCPAAD